MLKKFIISVIAAITGTACGATAVAIMGLSRFDASALKTEQVFVLVALFVGGTALAAIGAYGSIEYSRRP